MKRKMQITILLVCTEVKVCSILPCADGHESHPGHHGNKIIKPTLEFLTLDDEQQRQKVSGHRERKKVLHVKTSVKENRAASTNHRQALRCFLLMGAQKPDHFSKKSLPEQEDNVRSFPQPKTGSLLCLANEWIRAQGGCSGDSLPSSGCLCSPGGPQASAIVILAIAVPFLLISSLNLPCYSLNPSFPVLPSVGRARGQFNASLKDNGCYDISLYLLFFRLKPSAHLVFLQGHVA